MALSCFAQGAFARDATGRWVGLYECGQGSTALELIIRPRAPLGVEALFHFTADPSNPGVPEGCYAMTGLRPSNGGEVKLTARGWILRPPGYVAVDLAGRLSPDGVGFTGQVDGPGCTGFSLRRAAEAPLPSACLRRPQVVAGAG